MWLLHFLPDSVLLYVVNTVLLLGAIGSFLSFFVLHRILNKFPALAPYHLLIQIVSAVLLVAGIYFKGGYGVEMEWRAKVADLEKQLEVAKEESKKVNTVIETKVVTQTKVVKEKGQEIIKYVDRPVIQEYEKKCPLPKEVIDVHNEAAEMNLIIEKQLKESKK